MADYDDLLLQEDSSEYNCNDESIESTEGVKTRACTQTVYSDLALEAPEKPSSRIIKGSAMVSKTSKAVKRKGKIPSEVQPAKMAKVRNKKAAFSLSDITELKDKIGMNKMMDSLVTLTNTVQNLVTAQSKSGLNLNQPVGQTLERGTNLSVGRPCHTFTPVSATSQTVASAHDVISSHTVLTQMPENSNNPGAMGPPRQILSLDPNLDESESVQDFDLDYLNDYPPSSGRSPSALSRGFDPQAAFQEAFGAPSNETFVDDNNNSQVDDFADWDIPQLQAEEKTGPKISPGLAKAVNAAVTVHSSKKSIQDIESKYFRPDNCEFLGTPKVNPEVWRALHRNSHSQDLSLQEIQKSLTLGLVPFIQVAEKCVNMKEPLDHQVVRNLLSDGISLIGHGILSLSYKRRSLLRPYFNDRFKPICNQEVPVSKLLFGDDCMKRLKDLGDYTRIPIGHPKFSKKGNLNYRRPAWQGSQQVGQQASQRFYPQVARGRGNPNGQINRSYQKGYQGRGFPQGQRQR